MCCGCIFIIALVLLTLSFLVLVSLDKKESKKMKFFGYILVVLLWISTISVLAGHLYSMKTSCSCPMLKSSGNHHPMMQKK